MDIPSIMKDAGAFEVPMLVLMDSMLVTRGLLRKGDLQLSSKTGKEHAYLGRYADNEYIGTH